MIDMDDPSCILFSENIDESPNRKIIELGGGEKNVNYGQLNEGK
jgi:hypothetical protein